MTIPSTAITISGMPGSGVDVTAGFATECDVKAEVDAIKMLIKIIVKKPMKISDTVILGDIFIILYTSYKIVIIIMKINIQNIIISIAIRFQAFLLYNRFFIPYTLIFIFFYLDLKL